MKYWISFLFLVVVFSLNAQVSNNYKYVIVGSKFDFAKEQDGYKTSSLTKFLFNKIGFKTYLDTDQVPEELALNRCNALFANVVGKSNSLTIKATIQVKDCTGKVVFSSLVGKSKIKNYERGYYEAINEAFVDVRLNRHMFAKKQLVIDENMSTVLTPKVSEKNIVKTDDKPKPKTKKVEKTPSDALALHAKAYQNGYQLLDVNNKLVFVILKTNDKNKFFIKDKNGTLTRSKSGNIWVAEYYDNDKLVEKIYQIRF